MSCTKGPTVTLPVLPGGLSISAPKLPVSNTPGLCCKLPLPFPTIPNVIAVPMTSAIIATLNATMEAVHAALDAVNFSCPLD